MIRRIGPEEYEELCHRVAAVLRDATPEAAVVAVVSKGDPRLVEIEGRDGRHFPGDSEGRYAGYYPRTSEEAISHLEEARRAGVEYLCIPATALWWLDHYQATGGLARRPLPGRRRGSADLRRLRPRAGPRRKRRRRAVRGRIPGRGAARLPPPGRRGRLRGRDRRRGAGGPGPCRQRDRGPRPHRPAAPPRSDRRARLPPRRPRRRRAGGGAGIGPLRLDPQDRATQESLRHIRGDRASSPL